MTKEQQMQFCKVCTNRHFDPASGIVCKLTLKKPDFLDKCEKFIVDNETINALKRQIEQSKVRERDNSGGFFDIEKKGIRKGVLGGIIIIVIAVGWFFLGLATDRIFFYPPVLAIIGIVAIIKGLADGNFVGEK